MTEEAHLEVTPSGLLPAAGGWFVVNLRDTAWVVQDAFGAGCVFENQEAAPFPELGINMLLVSGAEGPLRAWDCFHSPAGTEHVIVGAGDEPSIVPRRGRAARPRALPLPGVRAGPGLAGTMSLRLAW